MESLVGHAGKGVAWTTKDHGIYVVRNSAWHTFLAFVQQALVAGNLR